MKCMICGRELSNPVSVARGIGPLCYSHHIEELRDLSSQVEDIPSVYPIPESSLLYNQSIQHM